MYCVSLYLNILCAIYCNDTALRITTDFSDDVHFLHAYHFKFTINSNIVNIPVEATFSMSFLCLNHNG